MNDIDNANVQKIAELWIALGGDKDGFEYLYKDIVNRIEELKS